MAKNKYETQFSVYKVDYNNSVKYFTENSDIKITSYDVVHGNNDGKFD